MSALFQDIKFGLRLLLKDRSFTITSILTLAVCIGANAAMFSVVRSVLLKPLPFPGSERVVLLYNSYPNAGAPRVGAAVPDLFDRIEGVKALKEQTLFRREGMTYGDAEGVERLTTIRAMPSFFKVAPIGAIRGRVFEEGDGEVGKNQKALLTYSFWQRRMAGRDDAIGKQIRLNGQQFEVVGVLPREFTFLQNDIDLFTPAAFPPAEKGDDRRHSNNWQMLGRMADGATVDIVQQQVDAVNRANDERFPHFKQILADAQFRTVTVLLQDDLVRDIKGSLYLLWGGVLFVLVIGCVNLANLMMVRSASRKREMATRHAIGGDLGRLARQLLTETTVLAAVGGLAGVLLAWWGTRSVAALNLDQLPRGYEIQLDPVGLGFALALIVGVGLVLGVAPALRLRYMNLNRELREESRGGTSGRRAQQVRRMLAMAQVAIALVLLIGAGLLLASFRAVMTMDFGFNQTNVVTANVNLPGANYAQPPQRGAFIDRALERLRGIPGVTHAGATTALPFSGALSNNVIMAEGHVMKPGESLLAPSQVMASTGYFESMQIPIVKGRPFEARDTAEATPVAIIDDRLAERFWPGQDPIGRRLYRPADPKDITKITKDTVFFMVVGVAKEVVTADPKADFTPVGTFYFPFAQTRPGGMTFTVRLAGPSATVANDIKQAISSIDPELPVFRIQTMQEWIDRALVGRRAPMLIAAGFSAVALFLAGIGIYGVLAYGVTERKRELGVRMALGGTTSSVFRLVLTDGLWIAMFGLAAGLLGSYFVGTLMQSLLFGVAPMNVAVIALVTVILAIVALIATGIPAMRASRINPVVVLQK
jgi:predicted permease